MATLHECLKELPPDEEGYEVRRRMERKSVHTHDRHERVSIGWIGGRNLMNQM